MEAATATRRRAPGWLAGLAPLLVLALAVGLFVALDAPGLDRIGVPQEELAVERAVLEPGVIELHVRNDGADPVEVRQVIVNDGFAAFTQSEDRVGRLGGAEIDVRYPWIEGQAYELVLLTATGATIDHTIDAAVETPDADIGFYGLMALIGLYVGVIPVAIGMLWLPWVRGVDARWMRFLLAFTIGLARLPRHRRAARGDRAGRRGPGGARGRGARVARRGGRLHRPVRGRELAPWAARAALAPPVPERQAPALATTPHSSWHSASASTTSERGLRSAPPTPSARSLSGPRSWSASPSTTPRRGSRSWRRSRATAARRLGRLVGLGVLAGAPAVVGAWIGASAFHPSLAALMFGIGAGAIAQVVVQIAPHARDEEGRLLHPLAVAGLLAGLVVMYLTGLAVSV